ncbi:MAG: hypothetical protein IIA60_11205 [Candidatus Marinimicrobia bacterium]|nr:hypothetical protein [Candidatus Neomarinimicrobiota bacterium]
MKRVLLWILLTGSLAIGQDILILKAGTEYEVKFIEIQGGYAVVVIKGAGKPPQYIEQKIPLKLIDRIVLLDGTTVTPPDSSQVIPGEDSAPKLEQQVREIDYFYEGLIAAESNYDTGPVSIRGFTAGVLGGFIGWGIGALILHSLEPSVPSHYLRGLSTYQRRDFEEGYIKGAKEKRGPAFNGWAAAGTLLAAIFLVYGY